MNVLKGLEVLKDISENVRLSGKVLLSGNADLDQVEAGTVDGKWNYQYNFRVREWMTGRINQSTFERAVKQDTFYYPRQIALSNQILLGNLNTSKIAHEVKGDIGLLNCAQILHMTFVGAPLIPSGDEYGDDGKNAPDVSDAAPSSFSSFTWDRSKWNYDIYNLYRSLIDLRKNFTAIKTGVYKTLLTDNENKIFAFGRFDENGRVITVTNQSDSPKTVELNAYELSLEDGIVLTDWLSGQQYTVKDGKVRLAGVEPVTPKWA